MDTHEISVASNMEEIRTLIFSQTYESSGLELHGIFWCKFSQDDGLHGMDQTYGHYDNEADLFRLLSQGFR
jgi:hypothetical protein